MTERASILAVGASVASAALVSQLRADGFDGRIIVVDRDPDMPYDRPPLSKEFLAGDTACPEAPWWSGNCDHVVGAVEALNEGARVATVRRPDGSLCEVVADQIVIATGSEPVRLPGQPEGVAALRTAADARALRRSARPGQRVIILGAGTVGTELASSLASAGAEVTLVDLAEQPLDRFLAGHLGDEASSWIRAGGVRLMLRTGVTSIRRVGATWGVATDRGEFDADLVVSAVGTRPAVSWLDESGLALDNGILCDADGQALPASGDPAAGIHAIGDVASWATADGGRRRREDWTSAQRQGRHVARRVLGLDPLTVGATEHDYFCTNQFGRRLQVLGTPVRDATLVQQVDDPDRNGAFYVLEKAGETVAWISVNRPREFAVAMRQSVVAAL